MKHAQLLMFLIALFFGCRPEGQEEIIASDTLPAEPSVLEGIDSVDFRETRCEQVAWPAENYQLRAEINTADDMVTIPSGDLLEFRPHLALPEADLSALGAMNQISIVLVKNDCSSTVLPFATDLAFDNLVSPDLRLWTKFTVQVRLGGNEDRLFLYYGTGDQASLSFNHEQVFDLSDDFDDISSLANYSNIIDQNQATIADSVLRIAGATSTENRFQPFGVNSIFTVPANSQIYLSANLPRNLDPTWVARLGLHADLICHA